MLGNRNLLCLIDLVVICAASLDKKCLKRREKTEKR